MVCGAAAWYVDPNNEMITSTDKWLQRADPNLIHWQRTGQPGVQEEARAILRAGQPVNRPPSYVDEGSLCDSPDASMHVPPLFHRANTSNL